METLQQIFAVIGFIAVAWPSCGLMFFLMLPCLARLEQIFTWQCKTLGQKFSSGIHQEILNDWRNWKQEYGFWDAVKWDISFFLVYGPLLLILAFMMLNAILMFAIPTSLWLCCRPIARWMRRRGTAAVSV